jgi:hypothetical protein
MLCYSRKARTDNSGGGKKGGKDRANAVIENVWMASTPTRLIHPADLFLDSGCTSHVCGSESFFDEDSMTMVQTPTEIQGFDKRTVKAYGRGNVTLQMRLPDGHQIPTRITNVWYIPNSFNLVSQSKLMDANFSMEIINHYGINIYAPSGSLAATAPQLNGLFCLDIVHDTSKSVGMDRINAAPIVTAIKETGFATTKEATQATLWHRCLCHLGPRALKLLPTMTDGTPSSLKHADDCDECLRGKLVRKPFKPTSSRTYEHSGLVHSDLCGPLPESIGGGKYMLLFIDNATRDTSIYILRKKSEALSRFKE